jgi:hypothetical protein
MQLRQWWLPLSREGQVGDSRFKGSLRGLLLTRGSRARLRCSRRRWSQLYVNRY